MYNKIKQLADEAIALQNKDRMEAALREIASIAFVESSKTMFEDARIAKNGSEPCPECQMPRAKCAPEPTATAHGETVPAPHIEIDAEVLSKKPAKRGFFK